MKTNLAAFLTALLTSFIFTPGNAVAGPTWAESFGATSVYNNGTVEDSAAYGPGYDYPIGIAQMPDGGVVVAGFLDLPELGSTNPTGGRAHPALVRYGPDGTILWQELLRPSNSSDEPINLDQLATDAQGNIFICGVLRNGGFPYVAKFNSSGALVWKNGIPCVGADCATEFGTMGLTADGGVFVGGAQYLNGNTHSVPSVAKFNSDGSLGFYVPYQYQQTQRNSTSAVCQSHDGTKYVFLVQPAGGGLAAVLLNSAGDIISQVTYPRGGEAPIQILATPDGGYVTLSEVSDSGGTLRGGVAVRKLNADLSEQFEKVITRIVTQNGEGLLYGNNIALTSDGGFLIGVDTPVDYRPYKAALMKLNSKGVLQFVSVLGGPKDENTARGIQMSDGGYAFTAATFSFTAPPNADYKKPDWWIVKTDSDRKVQDFGGVMADLSLSLFTSTDATRAATNITDFTRISPFTPATSIPGLVLEDTSKNTGVNKPTVLVQGAPLPPAPAHGGLSSVTFLVNDSMSPSNGVADTVLRFRALQTGIPVGLRVWVEATTTPNTESSWAPLANGRRGVMTLDVARNQFVLNSTDYPLQNGVYFRAKSSAPSYPPDSISNVIGPFNLASGKPHLPATKLFVLPNHPGVPSDLYFRATELTAQSGVALRIQSSTTPADEGSWTDLNNGNAGQMQQSTNPKQFILLVDKPPAAHGLYFRAVASLSGNVDSISQPVGAFNLVSDVPPKVTMTTPSPVLPGGGDGSSADKPILLQTGFFSFGASAQSSGPVKHLSLLIDGALLTEFQDGVTQGSVVTANVAGDHVLEAYAESNLGGKQRLGAVLYIRIVPQTTNAAFMTAESASQAAASTGHTYTAQSFGFWNNDSTWKDETGKVNGHPGPNDLAVIGTGSNVGFAQGDDIVVQSISIHGGRLNGTGVTQTLTVTGTMTITGGSVGGVNIIIQQGATLNLLNASDIIFDAGGGGTVGSIYNHGTMNLHGAAGVRGLKVFQNAATVNWQQPLGPPPNVGTDPLALARAIFAQVPSNSGLITGNVTLLLTQDGAGLIGNNGSTLIGNNSSTVISNDGGSIVSHDGGTLIGDGGATLIGDGGATLIGQDGAGLIGQDGAGFITDNGAANQSQSSTSVKAASASTGFMQTAGETDLTHVLILGPATINGGSLTGSGIVIGDLTNNSFISPGHSAGGISVIGNYTQGAQGTLIVENGGAAPNQYDHLQVSGTASLDGKLDIRDINGYTPSTLDTFSPLGFASATGSLSSVSSNAQVTMTANGLLASVNPSVPGPKPGQPLNISTRMNVLAGDNVLIGGFIVTGPAGSTKKVLIRGIGPSLAKFGVPGTLSDPFLELHKPDGTVVSNDNWQQGDTSQIPNGFAPSDSRESVIVATLSPGNYTAVLKGAHGETGVGLAEVYDLDSTSAAQLANISTRGFVNTGDNVMIGGFIVGGSEPAKVLVRAIGPSLTAFGVQGALPATTLELHDANGAVISNEGWRNTQEADITATTIPPSNDNEAAILATLVPGNYTAIVRGKNGTTGIGLVEAYNLQ